MKPMKQFQQFEITICEFLFEQETHTCFISVTGKPNEDKNSLTKGQ